MALGKYRSVMNRIAPKMIGTTRAVTIAAGLNGEAYRAATIVVSVIAGECI